jgi:hypothetical protein
MHHARRAQYDASYSLRKGYLLTPLEGVEFHVYPVFSEYFCKERGGGFVKYATAIAGEWADGGVGGRGAGALLLQPH